MKTKVLTIAAAILLSLSSAHILADAIVTNDGRVIHGVIQKEDDKGIELSLEIGSVFIEHSDIKSITRGPAPGNVHDSEKVQDEPEKIDLSPEAQEIISKLKREIEADQKLLYQLRKQLAQTPRTTEFRNVKPGETLDDLLSGKSGPYPNPDYEALKQHIDRLQGLLRDRKSQIHEIERGGNEGESVIEAVTERYEKEAAVWKKRRENEAELASWRSEIPAFQKTFETPLMAAELCVYDLMTNGSIREAKLIDVSEIKNEKAQWALKSGQWATAAQGAGISAPGSGGQNAGAAKGAKGAQVNYTFTFVTQAGLIRENKGHVYVANVDGFWEPWGYDVDGQTAPPYDGREAFERVYIERKIKEKLRDNHRQANAGDENARPTKQDPVSIPDKHWSRGDWILNINGKDHIRMVAASNTIKGDEGTGKVLEVNDGVVRAGWATAIEYWYLTADKTIMVKRVLPNGDIQSTGILRRPEFDF